jgi:hypothetical protein
MNRQLLHDLGAKRKLESSKREDTWMHVGLEKIVCKVLDIRHGNR